MFDTRIARTLTLLGVATLLGGCIADPGYREPYGRVYGPSQAPMVYEESSRPVVVYSQPPPPVEVVTVAPSPGYFWVGGDWLWEGRRRVWHPGYWRPPHQDYARAPRYWEHQPERQSHSGHSHPGYWRHR